jgi:hypothetical protein
MLVPTSNSSLARGRVELKPCSDLKIVGLTYTNCASRIASIE